MKTRSGGLFFRVAGAVTIFVVILLGVVLGMALAETSNVINQENFDTISPALPTKVVDINGTLITEYAADEKREMISISELPRHLIYAALAREDPNFYNHRGFSIRAIARALYGRITRQRLGGGSTITQQVAGTIYTNRMEYSISRKMRELWWAIQMERRYTKNEILEIYLNYMYMGPGVYGVEAASKYFFGHSAREITLAESAVLVVQLSSPARYNPLANPNEAMNRQLSVLNRMVELGFTSKEDAEKSFNDYWANYDYTRTVQSAYYSRDDKAPWFSEYVRRELDSMMYATMNYYRDGYTVHTTLDLNMQQAAVRHMESGIKRANRIYKASGGNRLVRAENQYIPIVNMLSLAFDINMLRGTGAAQNRIRAENRYTRTYNPIIDMAALAFGIEDLKKISSAGWKEMRNTEEQNIVEGALIIIENETGYIKAIVGGSKFDENNQFIRATQGRLQPGSSFKPLYYSAAIDSGKFTPSTMIQDIPAVYYNTDGTPYIPLNFRGEFKGPVLLYEALAHSMNVPSIKVLDTIGFDAAIDRASMLLGINDPEAKRRIFPHVYPLGLGIISIAPINMARAFATFANEGREVVPIAIRSIEDRNGKIIVDNEREVRQKQRAKGSAEQLISPQNAYVMTTLLRKTLEMGTLGGQGGKFIWKSANGENVRIAAAGKTGTTQNWADAWTVGFTPYYTTAIWFGFDRPGNSLGLELTGATLAGPVWGDFMREVHTGLPSREFTRPATGVVDIRVCATSGQLLTSKCNSGSVVLSFLDKYRPPGYCSYHENASSARRAIINQFNENEGVTSEAPSYRKPVLDLDALDLPVLPQSGNAENFPGQQLDDFEAPAYNPLSD
ncbi:MAG: PBP1A family penicillin-binding protein [Spirochaetaceae bacterium]|jgi:penicillin-binding protein 1A|nr:PBP1A family penicillin-binding protein [Spirochaetaceae bacterium]GMO21223.1 MAG: PBP1A family penicillin-binding protein [Termitinemataceae bacterium]